MCCSSPLWVGKIYALFCNKCFREDYIHWLALYQVWPLQPTGLHRSWQLHTPLLRSIVNYINVIIYDPLVYRLEEAIQIIHKPFTRNTIIHYNSHFHQHFPHWDEEHCSWNMHVHVYKLVCTYQSRPCMWCVYIYQWWGCCCCTVKIVSYLPSLQFGFWWI